jgi:glycosyltransferase involved in cell wall biosynthesis
VIGNHLPRQCSIATFTTDLCDAIAAEYGAAKLSVVAVNDPLSPYAYPTRVRFEITEGDISSYRAATDFLKSSNVDVVCLQHEYGIYGGKPGSYILQLLQHLNLPAVTTLYTVLREPDVDQLIVMQEIAARSDRLIVMSKQSSRFLQDVFKVPEEKINLIPHGIPDVPFVEPEPYKKSISTAGKTVLLTFGLLSPNKGFENVIQALPHILSRHNDVVYIIAGATHPHVRLREGDRYRRQLEALAKKEALRETSYSTTDSSAPRKWQHWLVRRTFTSRPTVTRLRLCREPSRMPWAPGRQSSRLRTGMLQNFWTTGAEHWFLLTTQPQSQLPQLSSWMTM